MEVDEARLAATPGGRWSPKATSGGLRHWNPVLLELVDECLRGDPDAAEARTAALALASILRLDGPSSPRVRLRVAARVLDELEAQGGEPIETRLRDGLDDPLLAIACGALLGRRPDGRPRSDTERHAVSRALFALARAVSSQEEVEALERLAGSPRR